MTSDLKNLKCKACEGGVDPLSIDDATVFLKQTSSWEINADVMEISRTYTFANFYETMAFVNVAAMVAHQQDHHPDMTVGYNTCHIEYSTHSIGGLSENDFICAAKTDKALTL